MIPKHGFACLIFLFASSIISPANAAMMSNNDTTIGAMEAKLFSHSYPVEKDSARLTRLERFVFGTASSDGSLDERLTRLKACIAVKPNAIAPITLVPINHVASENAYTSLANISSYPRVTQLEMRLLGHSYFGEPIAKRLSRLEISEFGTASTSKDLAERMDVLSAVTTSNAEKTKVNELASYQSPEKTIDNYRTHVYRLFQYGTVAQTKEQPNTVVDQIEYLESTAFGKIHHNKPLQKRVDALEEKYYGALKVDDKNLTYRVAQLLSLVNNGSAKNLGAHS